MKMRQDELMEILAQAGPKGRELATAISKRHSIELHVHINGPIVVGSELAQNIAALLFRSSSRTNNHRTP